MDDYELKGYEKEGGLLDWARISYEDEEIEVFQEGIYDGEVLYEIEGMIEEVSVDFEQALVSDSDRIREEEKVKSSVLDRVASEYEGFLDECLDSNATGLMHDEIEPL